ncbi:MAG: metallophosphoesterase [Crocinitomicaceae bacterium]
MRSTSQLLFSILIYLALEIYLFNGVRSLFNKSKKKVFYWVYTCITAFAILSVIIMFAFRGQMSASVINIFLGIFIINFISKLVLLLFVILDDLRRLGILARNMKVKTESGISRSAFLQKAGLISASVPLVALSTGIAIGGAYRYKVHKKKLTFKNLPLAFNGLKIVQISDIHSGSFYDKEAVKKGVQMIIDQKPDVVFFTGDIVNSLATEMTDYYDVFDKITAPMGVYSILGNHDYGDYEQWPNDEARTQNFEDIKAIHGKLGWKLLLDEHIYLEKEKEKIAVIGVENWGSGFHKIGDLAKAYQNCEADFKILLSHDPTHWDEEVTKDYLDIDLTLSGHTHGAQMGIETHNFKWSPIQLRYSKWAGLYSKGKQHLYINRGFGFLGYPGRIGIWPEITLLEINRTT